jgi:hypothetical protein
MFTFVNEIQESLYSNFALALFIHYFFAVGLKLPLCISQVMENRFYPEKKIIYSDNRIDILQVAFYDFLYCDTNVSKLIYGT